MRRYPTEAFQPSSPAASPSNLPVLNSGPPSPAGTVVQVPTMRSVPLSGLTPQSMAQSQPSTPSHALLPPLPAITPSVPSNPVATTFVPLAMVNHPTVGGSQASPVGGVFPAPAARGILPPAALSYTGSHPPANAVMSLDAPDVPDLPALPSSSSSSSSPSSPLPSTPLGFTPGPLNPTQLSSPGSSALSKPVSLPPSKDQLKAEPAAVSGTTFTPFSPPPAAVTPHQNHPPAGYAPTTTSQAPSGVASGGYGGSDSQLLRPPKADQQAPDFFFQSTCAVIPQSIPLLEASGLPLGLSMRPLSPLASPNPNPFPMLGPSHFEIPAVVPHSQTGIVRCRRCRSYVSPFVVFFDGGRRWKCNICYTANDVPGDYFSVLSSDGQRYDHKDRPELNYG